MINMPYDSRPPAPCRASCPVPSVPALLVSVLLRHHRTQRGLNMRKAGQLAEIEDKRLRGIEHARRPVTAQTVRTLMGLYEAPEGKVREAIDLLRSAEGGHRHEVDAELLQDSEWMTALKGAARQAVILGAAPLRQAVALASAVAPARDRGQQHYGTMLLLHEAVLEQAPVQHLTPLIPLVERKALSIRLIGGAFTAPPGLVTEWTLTAWGRDDSEAQRLRRQLYVTHAPNEVPVARNGPAAVADRQLIQAATRQALLAPVSAHLLKHALRHPRSWVIAGNRRTQTSTPSSNPVSARPA